MANESNQDALREPDGTLTSKILASLVVDELVRAGIVEGDDLSRAVEIVATEIDVRKSLGDY